MLAKKSLFVLAACGLTAAGFSSVSHADSNAHGDRGYYVQRPLTNGITIPEDGAGGGFGTPVAVLSATVGRGSYLITARIDGQSVAPNSGAVCYFGTDASHQIGTQYYTVNTSSDWTNQVNVSTVALNGVTITIRDPTTVSVWCAHGYLFTNTSANVIVGGEMTLAPVERLSTQVLP